PAAPFFGEHDGLEAFRLRRNSGFRIFVGGVYQRNIGANEANPLNVLDLVCVFQEGLKFFTEVRQPRSAPPGGVDHVEILGEGDGREMTVMQVEGRRGLGYRLAYGSFVS